jgi:hypothetical protein
MSTSLDTRPNKGARIAAYAGAAVTGFLALILIAIGGVALWANHKKDDDGYLTTHSEHFSTSTAAITTDDLDIDHGGAGWLVSHDRYGKLRLKVDSRGGTPVFVGIARTRDVDRYLGATAHSVVTDVDVSPFRAHYRSEPGAATATPPAQHRIWTASAQGSGRQTLSWDVKHGSWSIVVMNADGSRNVDARVSAGASVPILPAVGWGALGGGLLLLVLSGSLVFVGVRSAGRGAPQGPVVIRSSSTATQAS